MKKSDKRMVAIQMAKESIARFFDAAMTDPALAEKFAALAEESGYDFTATELLEFGEARPIPDNDAEGIHGGMGIRRDIFEYRQACSLLPSKCPHRNDILPRINGPVRLCTYFSSCNLAGSCKYERP